jgi:hypothetical protein
MLNEAHVKRSDMLIRDIVARMRHDGCGGTRARRKWPVSGESGRRFMIQ